MDTLSIPESQGSDEIGSWNHFLGIAERRLEIDRGLVGGPAAHRIEDFPTVDVG